MGGMWPYSCWFLVYYLQDLFNTARSILVPLLSTFFSIRLVSAHDRQTIMMQYENPKVKVRLPDGDTDFFDIVSGVQKGDTIAQHLSIICRDYVLQRSIDLMKENDFTLVKAIRYFTQFISDTNYGENRARFSQIHQHKQSPCRIVLNGQQAPLTSMSTQTKQSSCRLIKEATSPH